MELTGAVVGHIFGLEGFAFFIEAIFIGLYLYGGERLSPRAHWLCAWVIAISGMISGVLVLGVNAWMQLPVGFEIDPTSGRVNVTDPIAIFKQPVWAYMALHSTLACYLAVSFAVAGIYAGAWLRGRRDDYVRSAITVALAVGIVIAVLQPLSGDALAKFVYRTQPVKFASMEAQFKTQKYAPLRLGGIPDEAAGETRWALEIPGGLSFLATHDFAAEVQGLEAFPRDDWPNVGFVHLAFDIMVGSGMALLLVSAWFWLLRWRRGERVFESWALIWALALAGPLGFLGLEAGWVVTEAGRQPWIIHQVMRTTEAVTPAAGVPEIFFLFSALYILLAVTVSALLLRLRARPSQPDA
jgi:cytochrome d ubiquinol oxidase subunit I